MEVVLNRCVCVKKNVNFRLSYRCIASKEISAWKIPHLTCPNSECGEMKTYEASSSLARPLDVRRKYIASAAGLSNNHKLIL